MHELNHAYDCVIGNFDANEKSVDVVYAGTGGIARLQRDVAMCEIRVIGLSYIDDNMQFHTNPNAFNENLLRQDNDKTTRISSGLYRFGENK